MKLWQLFSFPYIRLFSIPSIEWEYTTKEGEYMRTPKYRLQLDEYEWGILVNSLMEMRNGLVAAGKDADPLNDLLLKIIRTKKRFSLFGRWC